MAVLDWGLGGLSHGLSGSLELGLAAKDAALSEALGRTVQAPKQFEELARHGHHGFLADHALGLLAMVVEAVEVGFTHPGQDGLSEHLAQEGAALFTDPPPAHHRATLPFAQVHAAVTQELGAAFEILQGAGFGQDPGQEEVIDQTWAGLQPDLSLGLELVQQLDHALGRIFQASLAAPEVLEELAQVQFQQIAIAGVQLLQAGELSVLPQPLQGPQAHPVLFHPAQEVGLPRGHDAVGVEPKVLDQVREGGAVEEEILFEGQLAEQLGQDPMDLAAQGDVLIVQALVVGVGFAQDQPGAGEVAVGEGFAQLGQQEHGLGIFEIGFGGVVALDHTQLAHTFGIEVGGEVAGLAGQAQEAPFEAAGGFTQDAQAGQAVLGSQSLELLQGLEDGLIAVGNGLLQAVERGLDQGQFGVGVEAVLADIEGDLEQIGIDRADSGTWALA